MNSKSPVHNKVSLKSLFNDFKQLTKVGLSISVVFTSITGYLLGAETIDYTIVLLLAFGGYLMVGASNAFNQVIEKDIDALMQRTKDRPLPAGRMSTTVALTIAIIFTIVGIGVLYAIDPKCALFGAVSIFLYTSAYTPLKAVTPLAVFVGAIPGAIPFMLGWVAATGHFGIEAGFLFMIQFFWQFPHFWAIGWLQFEEYNKAGLHMLPMDKKDKGAVIQIIFYTCIMILMSVAPVLKVTGNFYIYPLTAVIVSLLGVLMLYYAFQLYKSEKNTDARKLMLASVFYITIVPIIYVVDKFLH
ncbi:heme o synthase [Tenacibaculum finnmarkense]|uniref:Protoheme IX farnesyltransferase n=1 Tax=Tenacibaculum finnmarkense genomovar ulcerans TaxID=2781388 RepID=A0A2I2MAZ4_9FLAO|nr:heme o synthase [Tenacibaculum finnmarkense]MBE7644903.1 protoheme IX farnesyltransferase [Tenacibaculum finnmarkense genomovar ulcerans]MBE7696401.1 protoheme IX farnesyltransferase [Tenacibaculum finnmarkense genomovar ulcerans]MCD8409129.1 heme o synthase [Tenacibaculum finnmarkense genomovar ulcerans]MCD8421754.1 heme o synthase [Tenacibaculum finnmarkense genomovar ulcerans]MCD8443319.1 heme o synthase [Tenacibaculum finnmarkense genomovar ulcerans]